MKSRVPLLEKKAAEIDPVTKTWKYSNKDLLALPGATSYRVKKVIKKVRGSGGQQGSAPSRPKKTNLPAGSPKDQVKKLAVMTDPLQPSKYLYGYRRIWRLTDKTLPKHGVRTLVHNTRKSSPKAPVAHLQSLQEIKEKTVEERLFRLASVRDPLTNQWMYGRSALRKLVPGASKKAVENTIKQVRGKGERCIPAPTPALKQKRLREETLMSDPQIFINLPKLKTVSPKKKSTVEKWVIANDFHAPWHHEPSCQILYSVVQDVQPDKIVLLGDVVNLDPFSRYDKDPDGPPWLEDVASAGEIFGNLRQAASNANIVWRKGNHEERLKKYFMRHDPLMYDKVTIPKLFVLAENDKALKQVQQVEYKDINEEFIPDLNLVLKHGEKVRKHAGMSAMGEVDSLWLSVIMGHCHRLGIVRRSSGRSRYTTEPSVFGMETGCLCKYNIPYINESTTNWQHGFGILTIDRSEEQPIMEPSIVEINEGRALVGGKLFKA